MAFKSVNFVYMLPRGSLSCIFAHPDAEHICKGYLQMIQDYISSIILRLTNIESRFSALAKKDILAFIALLPKQCSTFIAFELKRFGNDNKPSYCSSGTLTSSYSTRERLLSSLTVKVAGSPTSTLPHRSTARRIDPRNMSIFAFLRIKVAFSLTKSTVTNKANTFINSHGAIMIKPNIEGNQQKIQGTALRYPRQLKLKRGEENFGEYQTVTRT